MNDFSRASDLLFSILFADDTSVFIDGTNYSSIIDTLNNELEKVNIWLNANKLTINIKKHITSYFTAQELKIIRINNFILTVIIY